MNTETAPRYAGRRMMIRRLRSRLVKPLTRDAELAAIASFIARYGVRRVTIDRDGTVRLKTVFHC
ncbi:MAG: hypothetical protein FJX66_00365 [Alphaproteobacteria bacterium]|nr:hypothetical protein [Alphaproteobacteria bacterium]